MNRSITLIAVAAAFILAGCGATATAAKKTRSRQALGIGVTSNDLLWRVAQGRCKQSTKPLLRAALLSQ